MNFSKLDSEFYTSNFHEGGKLQVLVLLRS